VERQQPLHYHQVAAVLGHHWQALHLALAPAHMEPEIAVQLAVVAEQEVAQIVAAWGLDVALVVALLASQPGQRMDRIRKEAEAVHNTGQGVVVARRSTSAGVRRVAPEDP